MAWNDRFLWHIGSIAQTPILVKNGFSSKYVGGRGKWCKICAPPPPAEEDSTNFWCNLETALTPFSAAASCHQQPTAAKDIHFWSTGEWEKWGLVHWYLLGAVHHPIMAQIGSGASTTVKTSICIQLQGAERGVAPKKVIYGDLKHASRWLDLWICGRLWHKIQKQELCNLLLADPFGGVPVQYCTNTTNALQIVWN